MWYLFFLLSHVISTTVLHHRCKIHSRFIIEFILIRICYYLTLIIYLYANIVPITCNNTFVVISGNSVVDNGICCSFWLTCENLSVNFLWTWLLAFVYGCVIFDTEIFKQLSQFTYQQLAKCASTPQNKSSYNNVNVHLYTILIDALYHS